MYRLPTMSERSNSSIPTCLLCALLGIIMCLPFVHSYSESASAASIMSQQKQQGAIKLIVNQIDGRAWPEITLNLSLTGADGKAFPGVVASQFEIREENQPQTIAGVT